MKRRKKQDVRRWKRRRIVLRDALLVAYRREAFTFLDLCIAFNELEAAYETLSCASR